MTIAMLELAHVCSGSQGAHVKISLFVGQSNQGTHDFQRDEVTDPMTEEEIRAWIKGTLKIKRQSMTWAQLGAALQQGLEIEV